jgi:hypothetical protein
VKVSSALSNSTGPNRPKRRSKCHFVQSFAASRSTSAFFVSAFSVSLLLTAQTISLPLGTWSSPSNDPILSPQGTTWESAGTFNPAVTYHKGKFIVFYAPRIRLARRASATPRACLGKSRSGSERRICRRHGPPERPLAFLLRRCGQIHWPRRSSSAMKRRSNAGITSQFWRQIPNTAPLEFVRHSGRGPVKGRRASGSLIGPGMVGTSPRLLAIY